MNETHNRLWRIWYDMWHDGDASKSKPSYEKWLEGQLETARRYLDTANLRVLDLEESLAAYKDQSKADNETILELWDMLNDAQRLITEEPNPHLCREWVERFQEAHSAFYGPGQKVETP